MGRNVDVDDERKAKPGSKEPSRLGRAGSDEEVVMCHGVDYGVGPPFVRRCAAAARIPRKDFIQPTDSPATPAFKGAQWVPSMIGVRKRRLQR